MSKPIKVSVNDSFNFDITPQELNNLNIVKTAPNQYHILQEHKSVTGEIIHTDFQNRLYIVNINNNIYQVKISNDLDVLIKQMGYETQTSKRVCSVTAPMPGHILNIAVKLGQYVTKTTPLLTLEAMKMENNILSPQDGTIKTIAVKQGDTVDKGTLLIEFELNQQS